MTVINVGKMAAHRKGCCCCWSCCSMRLDGGKSSIHPSWEMDEHVSKKNPIP